MLDDDILKNHFCNMVMLDDAIMLGDVVILGDVIMFGLHSVMIM